MLDELLVRFQQKDRRALSRLLTLASRGEELATIGAFLGNRTRIARVIAFTGSGGVGKSSLIGGYIERVRKRGARVAILACDPQSPLSGGALLGDRFRMGSHDDDGVFIRSLATRGGTGALADHLDVMIALLDRFGFECIVLETVGAGQGDTTVRALADTVVLLLQPESGDELQWEKAGLLEVADVVVIHKADLRGAETTASEVREALSLSRKPAPVMLVSSKTGAGLDELEKYLDG